MKYIGVRSCSCLPKNDSDYMGSSKPLDEAMKVEPEAFTKTILDTFPTREIASIDEQRLHEMYDVARNPEFYNQMNAPLGFCTAGKTRKPCSEETKKKISIANKGRLRSPESCAKMSKSMRGKKKPSHTEEHNRKIGDANRGKKHSEETKKKLRESHMGKTHSPETKKKLSLALKNRIFTEEHKRKIGDAHKGRKLTDEHKKKISENHVGMKGKKHSAESRKKMGDIQRGKKRHPLIEEHRKKISNALKGKIQPKATCPNCNKTGGNIAMKRWHFSNCKEISTIF